MLKQILILCLALLLFSCQEEQIKQVGLKGTLIGFVSSSTMGESGGIQVIVEGTNPQITVTTDDEGRFSVEDLETGTYDLVFMKSGFGTYKMIGYTFVGGNEPAYVFAMIYKLPDVKIKDMTLVAKKIVNTARLEGTLTIETSSSWNVFYRYYMSNNANVTPSNYQESGTVSLSSLSTNQVTFYKDINTQKFLPGSDLYVIIYPCGDQGYSNYIDVVTGNLIYSTITLQGSQVKTVKVPV